MRTPSRKSICGLVGLAGLGVAYDSGLFGPVGSDHLAVVTIPSIGATGSVSISRGAEVYAQNAVTGEDVAIPLPTPAKPTQI